MTKIYDVQPNELIESTALKLKEEEAMTAPEWAQFVKTGCHKERPPVNENWWHIRCAAILRSILKLGPVGVSKLRTKYGGKKNMGVRPDKFYKGSGSVIRKAIQQLEKAGFVAQKEIGSHKGRVITAKGKSLLDETAKSLQNE